MKAGPFSKRAIDFSFNFDKFHSEFGMNKCSLICDLLYVLVLKLSHSCVLVAERAHHTTT